MESFGVRITLICKECKKGVEAFMAMKHNVGLKYVVLVWKCPNCRYLNSTSVDFQKLKKMVVENG